MNTWLTFALCGHLCGNIITLCLVYLEKTGAEAVKYLTHRTCDS